MRKIINALILLGLLFLSGCGKADMAADVTKAASDPAKPKPDEPVTITMFGHWTDKQGDIATNLKNALKERYPEITLEYEAFPTGAAPYTDELERRIAHEAEADIFMTMDDSLWSSQKVLKLTKQEFAGRYSRAAMQQLSGDGEVYFLPGPGVVQCYVFNNDIITEEPQTLLELFVVCSKTMEEGKEPFLVPYEQTQQLLIKAFAAGYLSSPEGQLWLEAYNLGEGNMADNPQWQAVWELAEKMIAEGMLTKEDMLFAESRRATMMSQDIRGVSTISSAFVNSLMTDDEDKTKFRLSPFLGEKPENQTVFSAPTCFFAASSRLEKPGNEAKKAAVFKIFDFISTKEGQEIIRGTATLSNSYVNGVNFQLESQYKAVADILLSGSYGPAPVFSRGVDAVLGEAFGKMLKGEMTAAEAMAACDRQNAEYVEQKETAPSLTVIGTAKEKFPWTFYDSRTGELAVTNFVADSMCKAVGTDMAVELGTAVRGEFFEGEITDKDISSVIRVDKKLYRIEMTGQQMWDIIEQGVREENSSWFIVTSGLHYTYEASKAGAPGVLLELTTADGSAIQMEKTYTVAVSENQLIQVENVVNLYGFPAEDIEITLREAVISEIEKQGEISPKLDGRITIR